MPVVRHVVEQRAKLADPVGAEEPVVLVWVEMVHVVDDQRNLVGGM